MYQNATKNINKKSQQSCVEKTILLHPYIIRNEKKLSTKHIVNNRNKNSIKRQHQ